MMISKIRSKRLFRLFTSIFVLSLVFSCLASIPVLAHDLTYTITVSHNEYGTVRYGSIDGPQNTLVIVAPHSTHTFYMVPAGNSVGANVLVDGEPVGAISVYTFTNITADHVIFADFQVDEICLLPPVTTPEYSTPDFFPLTADLSITNEPGAGLVNAGDMLTYTIKVKNAGPHRADFPVVNDLIPDGAKFVSSAAGGWTFSQNGNVITFKLFDFIKTGGSATIAYTIQVPDQDGVITSNAAVKSSSWDPNLANNTVKTFVVVTSDTRQSIVVPPAMPVSNSLPPLPTTTLLVANPEPGSNSGIIINSEVTSLPVVPEITQESVFLSNSPKFGTWPLFSVIIFWAFITALLVAAFWAYLKMRHNLSRVHSQTH